MTREDGEKEGGEEDEKGRQEGERKGKGKGKDGERKKRENKVERRGRGGTNKTAESLGKRSGRWVKQPTVPVTTPEITVSSRESDKTQKQRDESNIFKKNRMVRHGNRMHLSP